MPDTVDAYTHRIGRTGRAELTGEAFTFAAHTDESMIRDIERVLGAPIERRQLTGFDYGGYAPESQAQQHHRNQPARPPSRSGVRTPESLLRERGRRRLLPPPAALKEAHRHAAADRSAGAGRRNELDYANLPGSSKLPGRCGVPMMPTPPEVDLSRQPRRPSPPNSPLCPTVHRTRRSFAATWGRRGRCWGSVLRRSYAWPGASARSTPAGAPNPGWRCWTASTPVRTFEERALAGKLLGELKDVRRALDLARLRAWLAGQTGWAEVDTTCQSGWTPAELLVRWDEWQPFLGGLAQDENISLRRASLVLLVSPLRASADERLTLQALANVEHLQGEKGPLIIKAISWVLRSMAQQQPELVRSYLDAHAAELPASAVRETRKKLETGRKTRANSRVFLRLCVEAVPSRWQQ